MKIVLVRRAGAGIGALRAVSARGSAGGFVVSGALVSGVSTIGVAAARSWVFLTSRRPIFSAAWAVRLIFRSSRSLSCSFW
jgi:hypothetical protein